MAWLLLYLFLLKLFFVTSIILKIFKTKLFTQNKIIIILKILFIFPFLFLYSTSNFLTLFPDVQKVVAKPKQFQHIRIINDTKIKHSFLVLKKHYLKSNWKFVTDLNTHINYSKIIDVTPYKKIDLLFPVDTNEFNRISICKITKSNDYPLHSLILEVPDNKYILFASEFNPNKKNKIIFKDQFEDWVWFAYNITFLLLCIFIIFHLPIKGKVKFLYYVLLIIISLGIGFVIYNDVFYLLKIYKLI